MDSDIYNQPFSKAITDNIIALDKRIHHLNKPSLIIIDGGLGEGKTTLGVEIGNLVNQLHGLNTLDLKTGDQIAMGGVDFVKKLAVCHKKGLPVLVYDEGGDFNKRGSLTKLNAMLNRTFETFRAFKVMIIICLPSMSVLDNGLYDKNIPRLFIRCYGRTTKYGNFKGYDLNKMFWIRYHFSKCVNKSDAYAKVSPLFYGHFKNLSPAASRQLDLLSTKGKLKELGDAEVRFEGLLDYEDISKKVLRGLCWVKTVMADLKIKPVKRYRMRFYFDPSAVDQILKFMDEGGVLKPHVPKKKRNI